MEARKDDEVITTEMEGDLWCMQTRKPAEAALLQPCFDKYVEHMLQFVRCGLLLGFCRTADVLLWQKELHMESCEFPLRRMQCVHAAALPSIAAAAST